MNESILIEKLNKMKNKIMERNVLLLIALGFGFNRTLLYSIAVGGVITLKEYLPILETLNSLATTLGTSGMNDTIEKLRTVSVPDAGGNLLVTMIIAFLLNVLGWGLDLRWSALAAGIIYLLSLFIPGASKIILIPAILCLLAFVSMKKMGNKTLGNNDKATNNNESRNSNEQ